MSPLTTLTFTIKNMNYQSKLYSNGLKPVYKIDGAMKQYKRIPGDLLQSVRQIFLGILLLL